MNQLLIAAAIALLSGSIGAWEVKGWKDQAAQVSAVKAAQAAERASAARAIQALQQQVSRHQEASNGYQNELEQLRSAPRPTRVVRLCEPATVTRVPQAAPTESRPDGPAAAPGVVPPEAGRDIGTALDELADQADRILAQARGLQRASQ